MVYGQAYIILYIMILSSCFYSVRTSAQCGCGWVVARGLWRRTVTDVSGAWSTLGLMGPDARKLLEAAAPHDDISNEALPFGAAKDIGVGFAPVRCARVTCHLRDITIMIRTVWID
jgi:hypothetical protein